MKSNPKAYLYVLLLFTCFVGCTTKEKKVPVISTELSEASNQKVIDSFVFYSHLNERFPIRSLKGDVHIVNFFFTTCTTICPVMESNLDEIASKQKNIKLVSFTIDPQNDSIPVLKKHHELKNNPNNWVFLRGSVDDLKKVSALYLSKILEDNEEEDHNFFHTSYVVLLDKEMRIRGLYNSLENDDIEFLNKDIAVILQE
ncbi:MAG: SCO family protein [Flavobacteriaceae bacterium]